LGRMSDDEDSDDSGEQKPVPKLTAKLREPGMMDKLFNLSSGEEEEDDSLRHTLRKEYRNTRLTRISNVPKQGALLQSPSQGGNSAEILAHMRYLVGKNKSDMTRMLESGSDSDDSRKGGGSKLAARLREPGMLTRLLDLSSDEEEKAFAQKKTNLTENGIDLGRLSRASHDNDDDDNDEGVAMSRLAVSSEEDEKDDVKSSVSVRKPSVYVARKPSLFNAPRRSIIPSAAEELVRRTAHLRAIRDDFEDDDEDEDEDDDKFDSFESLQKEKDLIAESGEGSSDAFDNDEDNDSFEAAPVVIRSPTKVFQRDRADTTITRTKKQFVMRQASKDASLMFHHIDAKKRLEERLERKKQYREEVRDATSASAHTKAETAVSRELQKRLVVNNERHRISMLKKQGSAKIRLFNRLGKKNKGVGS
jgi:hypothetical protein